MDNFPEVSPASASLPQNNQFVVNEIVYNKFDSQMMLRCIELARTALGRTSPNPLVGAVVVQEGNIVGEGFHPRAGEP
ncbi:bifunctional diaminohydroxyphosphoribosylaminopyrimidine deaminase/5-amino-6-(5-phosphoribosylamino)uracil reductase, partial [Dolichospermum sp. ST_con]|nr:bifunctional diaminohydroxyphosphoribosylaminopyrimidine deaminase/5-amino-6-(5-phosphoribosylamino)uracil reductase [Dolichospermum sp. ST_con]